MTTSRPSIRIRPFHYGDDAKVKRLLDQAAMSTVWPMFLGFAKREVTSHLILMLAAILFVVVGLQLISSLFAVPIVLLSMAVAIYMGHRIKIALTHADLNDVGQSYQSNPRCGFWVAEVVDKSLISSNGRPTISIGTAQFRFTPWQYLNFKLIFHYRKPVPPKRLIWWNCWNGGGHY